MNEASILDIISPVMVGPSSSHTAGAVRLGLIARNIHGENIKKVKIILYNSYAQTGEGHGTDKGLIAGLLGYKPDSTIIKDIFNSQDMVSLEYRFEFRENFAKHPNAVDFIFEDDNPMTISAQSIGGGEIKVCKINEFDVSLDGKFNSILIVMGDKLGAIAKITSIIQKYGANIATLNCDRKTRGQNASLVISLDNEISADAIEEIKKEISPHLIRYVKKLEY